jgi:hypothetical protein
MKASGLILFLACEKALWVTNRSVTAVLFKALKNLSNSRCNELCIEEVMNKNSDLKLKDRRRVK